MGKQATIRSARTKPAKRTKPSSAGGAKFDRMIAELGELADAVERGDVESRFTVRRHKIDPDRLRPTAYDAARVRALRDKLGISQAALAPLIGVSVSLVQSWERGRVPEEIACHVLDHVDRDPQYWLARLRGAVIYP